MLAGSISPCTFDSNQFHTSQTNEKKVGLIVLSRQTLSTKEKKVGLFVLSRQTHSTKVFVRMDFFLSFMCCYYCCCCLKRIHQTPQQAHAHHIYLITLHENTPSFCCVTARGQPPCWHIYVSLQDMMRHFCLRLFSAFVSPCWIPYFARPTTTNHRAIRLCARGPTHGPPGRSAPPPVT